MQQCTLSLGNEARALRQSPVMIRVVTPAPPRPAADSPGCRRAPIYGQSQFLRFVGTARPEIGRFQLASRRPLDVA